MFYNDLQSAFVIPRMGFSNEKLNCEWWDQSLNNSLGPNQFRRLFNWSTPKEQNFMIGRQSQSSKSQKVVGSNHGAGKIFWHEIFPEILLTTLVTL